LGAAVVVPPALSAASQVAGRCTKARADMSRAVPPTNSGANPPAISPMSWNIGSQKTPTAEESQPATAWMTPRLCSTFRWLRVTPFGVPVEPEEYCR
jgi:hypothetical protein